MIIDFHVHIFPPEVKADRDPYLESDAVFRVMYGSARARIATAEDLIASMDRAGVDVSVVQGFGWSSPERNREMNDYLLHAAERYPGRIVPFCTVQPASGEEAVRELERCAARGGPGRGRGIGEMRPVAQGYGADGWEALRPLYRVAMERGLPLLVHTDEPVGHWYPGKGRFTPDLVLGLVEAFPDWPVVLAHLGGGLPFYAAMPSVRPALAKVWTDTAAWPLLYGPEVFPALMATFGPEKLLFASDFPLLSQESVLQRTRQASLPPEAMQMLLGGNAARLLGLGDG